MPSHIPEDMHALGTYVSVADASAAIAWYVDTLGAREIARLALPDGSVMHAEVEVEGTRFMITDANAEWGTAAPGELSTYTFCLYVEDCDALYQRCLDAGATALQPVEDQFWGDRTGKISDPFGVRWMIMTHVEEVSNDEMEARFAAMMAEFG